MNHTQQIVILGGGYAGITFATRLDKKISDLPSSLSLLKIVLVDANEYHDLIQQAHLVAGGMKKEEEARYNINDILENSCIQFIKAFVKKIKADEKKVILEDNKEIEFDLLVVALGATTQSFGIKNVKKYCLTLHSIDDALAIKNKVQNLIDKNKKNQFQDNFDKRKGEESIGENKERKEDHIVIVGGGPTGTGIAGTISEFVNKSGVISEQIKIILVTASPTILQNWDNQMINEGTKILESKGVKIIVGSLVKDVNEDAIILDNGQKIPANLIIWTPGVKGFELPFQPEVEKTKDQRIITNEFCQIDKFPDIFCIGDIGAIIYSSEKGEREERKEGEKKEIKNPPLGQIAISQAIYLAETIPEFFIKGKKPMEKFDYDIKISILPMGEDDYIGTIDGRLVKGKIAKILKEFRYKAYKEEIVSDKTKIINDVLYKDDPVSKLLLGIYVGSMLSNKSFEKNTSKGQQENKIHHKTKEILHESKGIAEQIER
jgi:NADH:ubiquinone reductase (H+-translocating)